MIFLSLKMVPKRANMNSPEEGMKILARMIAEAYLEELSQKSKQQNALENNKEENDANKRNIRNRKATQVGQDKAGNQEEE